jgi:hypothetical protein
LPHGLQRRFPRTIALGIGLKQWVHHGLQSRLHHHLRAPIRHGRYP